MRHALGARDSHKPRVDLFERDEHGARRGPTALGEGDEHPSPIVRVLGPFEVTPDDQSVDESSRRLLGHTQIGDDVAQGGNPRIDESEDVTAVGGYVGEPASESASRMNMP